MSITELIEQLKAMPEKMEGFNSEGELVVLNTNKLANELEKSLRNCDVGTAEEQEKRMNEFCSLHKHVGSVYACENCELFTVDRCELAWAQMPYEEGGAE